MEVVERLRDAFEALGELDTSALGDSELGALLVELHRLGAVQTAQLSRLTAALDVRRVWADDGSRSAGAWLALHCHTSLKAMRAQVRLARRLRTMPHTSLALGAGEIDEHHAGVLARVAGSPRPEVSGAFPAAEEHLVGLAKDLRFEDFERAVRYWEQIVDPDGVERTAADDHAARYFHALSTFRGNVVLQGQLDPVSGAEFKAALERIESELFRHDWNQAKAIHGDDTRVEHLGRSPGQRRADALCEMARRASATPADARESRPLITVLVDYETLAGRVCELSDGTVITPGHVATLIDRADVERVVFDTPSRVIDVGQRTRFFTGALRRAIEVRDRRCTHPGCDQSPERCQGDHIDAYSNGGLTTQDNGQLQCGHHNRWRHNHPPNNTGGDNTGDNNGGDSGKGNPGDEPP